MELPLETDAHQQESLQTIRVVADVIDDCNLGCHYCHPMMGGWSGNMLSAEQVGEVLQATEDQSMLEVTLTGGEITMHPEFSQIMEETHRLGQTALSIVTNATNITPKIVNEIGESNIDRVCVSLDGPDAASHNSRRGRNFDRVMTGLRALQGAGKPITIISVAHKENYRQLTQLSAMLAEERLAEQHHLCAASYSGAAKRTYPRFAFEEAEFQEMQDMVDEVYPSLLAQGFYLTFNSYWPATGQRGAPGLPRTLTTVNVAEQVKDTYALVRSNGDVRLTVASWGRETVGNAVVGNLNEENAHTLLEKVDDAYRSGECRQLPRDVEAGHKFLIGSYHVGRTATNDILQNPQASADASLQWEAIRPLARIDLLDNPLPEDYLPMLAQQLASSESKRWRIVRHASGVDIVFDRNKAQVTLLKPDETARLRKLYSDYTQPTR